MCSAGRHIWLSKMSIARFNRATPLGRARMAHGGAMLAGRSVPIKAAVLIGALFFSLPLPAEVVVLRNVPACPSDQPEASWNNCQATKTLPDGSKYVGEYKNGKSNGNGTLE